MLHVSPSGQDIKHGNLIPYTVTNRESILLFDRAMFDHPLFGPGLTLPAFKYLA